MKKYSVIRYEKGLCRNHDHELIQEEPFLIRVDGKPYSVVMRTPGEEIPHAAGFCLGEGLIENKNDFVTIGFCEDRDQNVVDVRLKSERRDKIPEILERRGFISQTSCGICGKEMIEDLYQTLIPAKKEVKIDIEKIFESIDRLSDNQAYYSTTRGSHAAMLVGSRLDTLSFAEDVGRHNALDKAIGKLLLEGNLDDAVMVILSSRISYELVQKAARARLPIMVSESRPTGLAVEMGQALNMTLACTAKESELLIFTGEKRIIRK
jgi:FdhD protein